MTGEVRAAGEDGTSAPVIGSRSRLVLVRHAATDHTLERRLSGRSDPPLGAAGRGQALALAGRIAALVRGGTAVLASPLVRARQTAEAVADRLGSTVRVEPSLAECDFGAWEGLTFAEIGTGWPRELSAWLADTAVAPPGGESIEQVATRYAPALAAARRQAEDGAVVVVAHATTVKLALRQVLGGDRRLLDSIDIAPAGISVVDSWPDGGAVVRTVNETAHL